ncbi:uncharacterized protein LOC129899845 [Solanum dulcamara]|uniref:uncharacterized protein LOC129899845 n=1 Tax=Solanum dulcamara TaxID=45834 RepID=UPI002485214A|nr:uncharacterized protein LOC129899845 [Solanum dulcamara]
MGVARTGSYIKDIDVQYEYQNIGNWPYGTNLLRDAVDRVELIQQHLVTAQSRQESYVYRLVRDASFVIYERVLLKVSPIKGVIRFRKKEKLSPRFNDPFEVLEKYGEVAYRLVLPLNPSVVYLVFYASMLKRYRHDDFWDIWWDSIVLYQDLLVEDKPVAILDSHTRYLRSKHIDSVKV